MLFQDVVHHEKALLGPETQDMPVVEVLVMTAFELLNSRVATFHQLVAKHNFAFD